MHSLSISCARQHIIKRHNFFITASSTFSSISTQRRTDDSHHHLQSSSSTNINTQEDWRDWFRSSDYDDAWSAYQPFSPSHPPTTNTSKQQQEDTNNSINNIDITTTHQKQIIPSILNGTWKRRIFGMNLVPLCMTYNGVTVDDYIDAQGRSTELEQQGDNSTNNTISNLQQNHQQQSSPHIETVPNNPEITKQLSKLQRIDIQTRFLCRMLDDLYRTGIWREIDRPRTERCHRAIGRLMTMTPEDPPRRPINNNASTSQQQQEGIGFTGLAQRAGAILYKLELCSPLALRNKQQVQSKSIESAATTDVDTAQEDIEQTASAEGTTSTEDSDTTSSYQGVYNSYPQHLSHTKFALPTPTSKIYNMVLLSYGKEVSGSSSNNETGREGRETGRETGREVGREGREVPQQAEDVIWGMLSRVVQQQQSMVHNDDNVQKKESNSDLLYPTVENWNCVLCCWSKSYDTDKAFYAFSFLLSWLEWNKQIELNDELYSSLKSSSSDDDGVDDISKPDMDSFYFVLQSCLVDDEFDAVEDGDTNSTEDESKNTKLQRAKEMGAGVAIRLWNEMQRGSNKNETSMDIDSTMYYEILQAICQSSELPSTKSTTTSRPLAALARVFTSCCKDGMNTLEIMNLVRDHTTESQFDQLKAKVATFL